MKKSIFWTLIFFAIFFLSQDYLFVKWQVNDLVLGFPGWLWWFFSIHILFVLVFFQFIKRYWEEK